VRTLPSYWVLRRIVVDDATIARDDIQSIIDPVWYAADGVSLEEWDRSLAQFSRPQRLVFAVLWASADICNGGLTQYFANWTGLMSWPDAVEGFAAIGRDDLANILREAAAAFPLSSGRNRKIHEVAVRDMPPVLEDLTGRYYDAEGDLYGALMSYVRSQPEAFYFDGKVHMPPREPQTDRDH
jgi:hypothetical protein